MTGHDEKLEAALRAMGSDPIDETGYYRDAFASLKGEGSGLRIAAWIGTIIFSAATLYCFYKMLTVEPLDHIIKYGIGALAFSQGQIALKLWCNMQLNRRAVTREIRRLGLLLSNRSD